MRSLLVYLAITTWFMIPFGLSWALMVLPFAPLLGADVPLVAALWASLVFAGVVFVTVEHRYEILDRLRSQVLS